MQEIKNCPICGREANMIQDVWDTPKGVKLVYFVRCGSKLHQNPIKCLSEDEAAAQWNDWVIYKPQNKLTGATIRREILDEAARCVCGDRENQYGSPEDNFRLIAALWGDYLRWEITPVDVAMMMTMFKIAQIKSGTMTRDSFVDAAGYIACGGEIAIRKGETRC